MRTLSCAAALALATIGVAATPSVAEPTPFVLDDAADWSRIVPGDVHFYVEMRDLASVQRVFQRLGIWETVRGIAEREESREGTSPWRRTTEEHLGLGPDAVISQLLGRRTALFATESAKWQSGVVITELEQDSDLRMWLRRWRGRRMESTGEVQRYELRGGILLAALGKTLAFGPAGDPDGLWARTVLLMSGRRAPMLAGRSEFAALRSRLSREYPGLLYAVLDEGQATAVGNCRRLLVGFSVSGSEISCELHGQRPATDEKAMNLEASAIGSLPASTLAVRAASFDFASLAEQIRSGRFMGTDTLLTILLDVLVSTEDESDRYVDQLGPGYVLVAGVDRYGRLRGVEFPALTILCDTRMGEEVLEKLDVLFNVGASFIGWSLDPTRPEGCGLSVQVREWEGVHLHHVYIGPALAKRTGMEFLDGLDFCWTLLDGKLVLSTSAAHVEDIILAARGKAPRIADRAGLQGLPSGQQEGTRPIVEWSFASGTAIAKMVNSWLAYLERDHPEMLKPEWWQIWAALRLEHLTRLGVGLVGIEGRSAAVVKEVMSDSPAAGILRRGDIIVGVGGTRLTTSRPAHEVADRYWARGDAREFELQIRRHGENMTVKIPVLPANAIDLEHLDPIRSLRQLITLSSRAESALAWRYATEPDRFDARILIRWERPERHGL